MKNLNHLEDLIKTYVDKTAANDERLQSNWGRRLTLQLMYAVKLSETADNQYDDLVTQAIEHTWQAFTEEGAVTRTECLAMEQLLAPLAEKAKALNLICIGHAHIDMNWMWSYDETVSVTLETLRTMLDLMDDYPDYTYAQSQASVYEIVARHDPEMLERIRERVREGRWEVTASTWVEADRNMPNAESMARHFLYTRRYLADLLQIDPATLDLDYEPDTFGHHQNVPEVLRDAGVRYYYHCRGADGPYLYRWQSPSGRSILAYREPLWYNWDIDGRCALVVPKLCRDLGMNTALRVYGVGDHGGGPTRRDIEKILEMDTWPIFPHYQFGTYHDFFRSAEAVADSLPVITGELNFIFDGCYTTQTRIKRGNRQSEQALLTSELTGALVGTALGWPYPTDVYAQAWKKVLFNQFHDILPGSGTVDTREYAMALYQEAFALTSTQQMKALRALAGHIDTTALTVAEDIRFSRAEGAGAGFPTGSGNLPRTARHSGLHRLFMVWNPLPFEREELCELTIWDWSGDIGRLQVSDGYGQILNHQVMASGKDQYWGHRYQTILVFARVPASGYRTLVIDETPLQDISVWAHDVRKIKPAELILENEYLQVTVSEQDGTILSLLDKETGRDYADACEPTGVFRLIRENASRGMTAWVVGAWRQIRSLHQDVKITDISRGDLRQSITWMTTFGNQSDLTATLSLDQGERQVRLDVKVRWQEIGNKQDGLPQLNLLLPTPVGCQTFRYDIPMGEIERP
ncbi:MAG: glycoside hydrolase family 38 C-terminal domain-containing protein, partial [Bacillota bacterium]|nr:glycoside hydrolase family 38 C-terminal domain-containing protein [Bacillota bacterium]